MVVDLSDWRHHEILALGIYEPHISALLERVARPGWTFIDIGANVGYFSVLASRLGGPDATVHAFEPHPRMAAMAEINARINEDVSYTVIQAACGACAHQHPLNLAGVPGNIGNSTMLSCESRESSSAVVVDVMSLDEYCDQDQLRPDVVKIDVEGFEGFVLDGMKNLLGAQIPSHVIIELGGDPERPSPGSIVARLVECGYRPHGISDEGALIPYVPRAEMHDVCFVCGDGRSDE